MNAQEGLPARALPAARPSPFKGRWLWATLAVTIGLAALVSLGFWQLQRLQERRASNAHVLARLALPPLLLDGSQVDPQQVDLRRAVVRGTYDFSQEILLRNQAENEVPGMHLITPLRLAGSDVAVLVDRGWVPIVQPSAAARAPYELPTGEVEIRGVIRQSQARLNALSPADAPASAGQPLDAWFRVDIPHIQQQVPYRLLPIFVEAGDIVNGAPVPVSPVAPLPHPAPDIQLDEGPHLGYAIQWFSFATILLVGYVVSYMQRTRASTTPQDADL